MKPGGANPVPEPEYVDEILPEHLPVGQLNVVVFGPGEGEAILVRLPDGGVGVVDGCREPEPDHPEGRGDPVRELLVKFAASTPSPDEFRLEFVCLTHPHADHYRGLGRLLEAYEGRVGGVWTVTLKLPHTAKALSTLLDIFEAGEAPDEEVRKGLERVLHHFETASARTTEGLSQLSRGKSLLRRRVGDHPLSIDACGPADGDINAAHTELLAIFREGAESGVVSRKHDPNLTSGALLLRWGSAAVLLGGDLLCGNGPLSGWNIARKHVEGKVQVVNVAHHASLGAHDDLLWRSMAPDLAIVTPFRHGKRENPPRPEQISALSRDAVVTITSPPAWKAGLVCPMNMRSAVSRIIAPKNKVLRPIVAARAYDDRRNAVAVSLDATGKITRFVLAGKADVYLTPEEHASPASPAPPASPEPKGARTKPA